MTCIIRAISSHSSSNKIGLSLSGPAALPGFRFFNSFSIQATEIGYCSKSSMTGGYFCISGGVTQRVSYHSQSHRILFFHFA